MARRAVNNLLGVAVLAYLTQRPMHPYELQRSLRDNDAAQTFKLSYGALYSVVAQLARAGFVEPEGSSREGNLPERTVYRLTPEGREELHDWLRELLGEPRPEFPAFVAGLSLIVVLPRDEVVDLLRRRVERLEATAENIRATVTETTAQGVHPVFLVEDDYRCALITAEIAFIRDLVTRITTGRGAWADWTTPDQAQEGPP